jgi:subtilase-type serine protease
MVLKRLCFGLTVALAAAGCKSDGTSTSTGGETQTPSGTLSAYFVENFNAFEAAALRLIITDLRYTVQDVPDNTWYLDKNNNDSFDAGIDVWLNSSPLKHAGIHYAHAAGLTGAGQVVAISDSGFRLSHEVFDGKNLTVGSGIVSDPHGTFTASIVAANTPSMIGVAPGADLILGSYNTNASLTETALAAYAAEAVALSNSWGFVNTPVNATSYSRVFGSTSGRVYLDALRTYSAEGVVLFALSNEYYDTQSGLMAALPMLEPNLEAGWLAVVNGVPVMVDDDIISAQRVSAGCNEAARWCIAADGSWTGATDDSDSAYAFGTGTSFATPTVAGSLALLAEAFPDLSPHDLRIRLLASADNEYIGFNSAGTQELVEGFNHEYSDEWGHGFLDVKAALMPIGDVIIPTSDGTRIALNQPLAVEGGASGDAITAALRDLDILATDALQGRFTIAAESLVARRSAAPLFAHEMISTNVSDFGAYSGSLGFFGDTAALPSRIGNYSISFVVPVNADGGKAFGMVAEQSYQFSGGTVNFNFGIGQDGGSLTPNWYTESQSSLVSAGIRFQKNVGLNSALEFELGLASAFNHSGNMDTSGVLLSSARVTYAMQNTLQSGDQLALSVVLPTAVVSGQTELNLPVVRTDGAIESRTINVGLAPENREIRIRLDYEVALNPQSKAVFSLQHAENMGNITAARDTGLFVGFKTQF